MFLKGFKNGKTILNVDSMLVYGLKFCGLAIPMNGSKLSFKNIDIVRKIGGNNTYHWILEWKIFLNVDYKLNNA